MEYTVQKLSELSGITARTIRYYDELGILKPARISSSGYRIYGQKEVDKLQQILFYRELGVKLEEIKEIVNNPTFDMTKALVEHREKLLEEKNKIEMLLANVEKTIATKEGKMKMSDKEKFEGFKQQMIDENEKKYGKEIREKYGKEQVEKSHTKFKNMTEEQFQQFENLGKEILETLKLAVATGNPASELAQKTARLHKEWLSYSWDFYSEEAHAGLAQMYVDDERFSVYYDKEQTGGAKFLRDAILVMVGKK